MRNAEFFSGDNKTFAIEHFSDDFFDLWKRQQDSVDVFGRRVEMGGNISFCYIDGKHTYDFARRDFENVDQFIDPGGYILFDDSDDSNPFGLTRLMKEISRDKRYELVIKNPNYLFRRCR